ncbi:hypothetical protein [Spartinivicinus ruber]|uniref:hypothetical protein n=1 Tax=Spartinivicinus ruber TaxID=2683272 RepID=UPI0013D2D7DD|nr:hypothetical protein [Spartinivicinus ruber]
MKYCYSSLLILNEDDIANIHPSDRELVSKQYTSGWQRCCFEYLGESEGYKILKDGENILRVKEAYIEEVPAPGFKVGEVVFLPRKKVNGVIKKIHWHIKKCMPIYTIVVNGKVSGYQYFDTDIEAIV